VTSTGLAPAAVVLGAWTAARWAMHRIPARDLGRGSGAGPIESLAGRVHARLAASRMWRRFDERLPEGVAAVARSLRSGASLRQALAEAAASSPQPVAAPFAEVLAAADAGRSLPDALDDWARRCPRRNVRLLVTALSVAHDTGGASAQAVDGVAATLRRRQAARAEAAALATQARTSAYVLAGVPLVVCVFALATGGASARFLLGTPVGLGCLALGLALDAAGAWWMLRITASTGPRGAAP
jgi:tight adherence protein B